MTKVERFSQCEDLQMSEDLVISFMQSLAQEVLEHRATLARLEVWAQQLEKDTLSSGGTGLGVFLALELRNRIKGTP